MRERTWGYSGLKWVDLCLYPFLEVRLERLYDVRWSTVGRAARLQATHKQLHPMLGVISYRLPLGGIGIAMTLGQTPSDGRVIECKTHRIVRTNALRTETRGRTDIHLWPRTHAHSVHL